MNVNTANENIITKNKSWLIIIVKLIIAAGILYYLVSYINYNEIVAAIKGANIYLKIPKYLPHLFTAYLRAQ